METENKPSQFLLDCERADNFKAWRESFAILKDCETHVRDVEASARANRAAYLSHGSPCICMLCADLRAQFAWNASNDLRNAQREFRAACETLAQASE